MKFNVGYCGKEETLNDDVFICKLCQSEFKTVNERNKHLKFSHNLTFEQYVIKFYFDEKYPECKCGCGEKLAFKPNILGFFHEFTSNHFPRKPHSIEAKNKIREGCEKTMLEKYGVKNVWELKEIKEKILETKLKKYGDENYNNQQKSKQTKLDRYGDENYNE